MKEKTVFKHVALHYKDRKQAEDFFTKILGLPLLKTFSLTKELSDEIFGINEEVTIDVYANEDSYFEVFITQNQTKHGYEHVCIEVNNKDEFIERCKQQGIEPKFVKKGDKTLLFIKDHANNLYEIKHRE